MPNFTHLHVHSEYSLLDGLAKISKLVTRAKELEFEALALTDHGVLYGSIEFYKAAKAAGIKPIIGCEAYFTTGRRGEKLDGKEPKHLILLAKDFEGYRNLIKLVTIGHLEGFYYKPRIDFEVLGEYRKSLICLSGCLSGPISKAVLEDNFEEATELIDRFKSIFGEDFYLEIKNHEFEKFLKTQEPGSPVYDLLSTNAVKHKKVFDGLVKLAAASNTPLAATNDVHYIEPKDAVSQDILLCIQTGRMVAETDRLRMVDTPTFYLASGEEMEAKFPEFPEALENTFKISKKCELEIPIGKFYFPDFNVPTNVEPFEYLKKLCLIALGEKFKKVTDEVKKRLNSELEVIKKKGYSSYFLVVCDIVTWARAAGIVSAVRGSAAGSLVSYLLGITTINPLEFNLPFERFLNPFRPTLPDIDVDFADDKREEVLNYVREKYGKDKVAQIGTFGRMLARAAVRDVARVLGWPYTKADRMAKLIPAGSQGFPMTLERAKKISPEMAKLTADDEVGKLLDLAEKIEGNARHASVHAAGVVIAPTTLTDFVPLQKETGGENIITQYDMYSCEDAGLVKIDLLGVRNLSILQKTVELVEKTTKVKIVLEKIPLNDLVTFKLLSEGKTMGVFQLSGPGMTRYLKELKPTNIFDIMAMISLFRPGPMQVIPEFIARKHDKKKIKYLDPRMESFLEQSYGVIVYQDDVLLTAVNLAGYNWEEADKFRKAMGKKIPSEMAKQKDKFIGGCVKNGMMMVRAEKLFSLIEPFSAYGFNKAHAASYAVIAYQTAYLKTHYPVEFMAALMSAESDDAAKLSQAVTECKNLGIEVLGPDINKSNVGFTIEYDGEKKIRFGLSAIKNVGQAAITEILAVRGSAHFLSLSDFCNRVNLRAVNRKTIESLIKAGAMDQFGARTQLLETLAKIKNGGKVENTKQAFLFSEDERLLQNNKVENNGDFGSLQLTDNENLAHWERELLGFYFTDHPYNKFAKEFSEKISCKLGQIFGWESLGQKVILGGVVVQVRKTFTKATNSEMAFVRIEDDTGKISLVVFPRVFSTTRSLWVEDTPIVALGRIDLREDEIFLIVEDVAELSKSEKLQLPQIAKDSDKTIQITLPPDFTDELLAKIQKIIAAHPGRCTTNLLMVTAEGETKILPLSIRATPSEELISDLTFLGCTIISL